jgi:hypothetical protein
MLHIATPGLGDNPGVRNTSRWKTPVVRSRVVGTTSWSMDGANDRNKLHDTVYGELLMPPQYTTLGRDESGSLPGWLRAGRLWRAE